MSQKYTIMQKVAMATFALCVAFIVGLIVVFGDSNAERQEAQKAEEQAKRNCSDGPMAFIMSQGFVKRELKSPSSAKFPYAHDDGVSIQKTGECKFRVRGFVDAQNSFGAMIRTPYSIDMEYFPDSKKWGGSNLSM
jgi:hypothetical protein